MQEKRQPGRLGRRREVKNIRQMLDPAPKLEHSYRMQMILDLREASEVGFHFCLNQHERRELFR